LAEKESKTSPGQSGNMHKDMRTDSMRVKESRVRTIFNICAAVATVFGFGLEMKGSHPIIGICLMASAVAYLFWELFTSPVAIQRIAAPLRLVFVLLAFTALSWISWPHVKAMLFSSMANPDLPNLVGNLNQITIHDIGSAKPEVSIIIIADITNFGSPSIILDWQLRIKVPDGRLLTAEMVQPPKNIIYERFQGDPGAIIYDRNDWLPRKTAQNPIGHDGNVRGFIYARLENIKTADLYSPMKTEIELRFSDVHEKWYSVKDVFVPNDGKLRVWPGVGKPSDEVPSSVPPKSQTLR